MMQYIVKDLETKTEQTLDIADIMLGTREGDNKTVLYLADGKHVALFPADRYVVSAKQKESETTTPQLIDPAQQRITELKTMLTSTDYQAIKYAEGLIPPADYAPIKVQRQAWRDEINTLEKGG